MANLVLVKHSNSNHNAKQEPGAWVLTEDGVRRCKPLANHLQPYLPQRLFSSPMPKALQTAQNVSRELEEIPIVEILSLAEHSRRSNAPYGSVADFNSRMKRFFEAPDALTFGDETANQARDRFQRGIENAMAKANIAENIVVIAHGTVMVMFAAHYNSVDPFDLWQRLKLPSMLVLDLPDFRISKVIEDAGSP